MLGGEIFEPERVNSIPLLDLAQQYQQLKHELDRAVLRVMASGRYIGGESVMTFEREFADYLGTNHCVSCNSGTDALFLALRALDIGPGDQVVTTPFTFIATVEMISAVGATPVFVDIDPETFNLDLAQLAALLTASGTTQPKAILPVHLFGRPLDMTTLMALAQEYGIPVIEDCAQATGATWEGQQVGSFGAMGCFSFFPTKNLGTFGDGGAIATNDPQLAQRLRTLKEHGATRRYYHEEIGINSRLDAMQAAILSVKLGYLDSWNQQRRQVADRYQRLLAPLADLHLPSDIPGHVWNQYSLRLAPTHDRDRLRSRLQELGVGTMVYYPTPLHSQPVYRHLGYSEGDFPATEAVCHEVLSLPMFPELKREQQERVLYHLKQFLV
ncbi:DegT/DnrJ/EryC1/StrS family aminotransferase [Geitlerinema sp. P-1104]|uniref:DegT/DnrJ/EryC1/StrS family aminotransferase n=1 Tax=Geitlerinema sp. P-1104 TaxID=2546230 RepID=UPI00197E18C7|nr:DegT/DnrJ/EryC1/StrS family aminotransferase [Geitlerinema sp. P-1104]